jgi:hypothetical protein
MVYLTTSVIHYRGPNARMSEELERMRKEAVVVSLKVLSRRELLEGSDVPTKCRTERLPYISHKHYRLSETFSIAGDPRENQAAGNTT